MKLFDSELKVMEVLWKEGDLSAGQIAKILAEQTRWNRNTTYTVIKKLVQKGAIQRSEPGFLCRALVPREAIQQQEAADLIDKLFDGSAELFFSAYLHSGKLSQSEINRLKQLMDTLQ